MKRKIYLVLSMLLVASVIFAACTPAEVEKVEEIVEEAVAEVEEVVEEEMPEMIEIALIIKATDSGFWQAAIKGGEAFGADNDNVNVG